MSSQPIRVGVVPGGETRSTGPPPRRDHTIMEFLCYHRDRPGSPPLGTAVLVPAPDAETAHAVLTADRYADVEVHTWQFGGRPAVPTRCRRRRPPGCGHPGEWRTGDSRPGGSAGQYGARMTVLVRRRHIDFGRVHSTGCPVGV
ncbi:hypothetical protein ACIQOW_37315 [Kitasatospora sp. NPDC091335]|uniref:hypothetical protein n=1 Tax=Kitasatospora sp. NPDC091335 TaxID=3364085 RepID=UPI00381B1A86